MSPACGPPDTQRGEADEEVGAIQGLILLVLDKIEGNVDADANHGENDGKVTAHLGKS